MRCASCGTENRAGSRFCDNCGSELSIACAACGEPNRLDARFCASCGAPMEADAVAAPEPAATPTTGAERRLVSVLFSDLVGFTTYAQDRDPEHVRDLLNRYFATATEVVARHGGTVEKFIGDAVMAVWGAPVAHEDDAERAVRAALEIIDAVRGLGAGLEARVGVLTGEAAVTVGAQNQGMVAGDLVNTAARLQGVADPGTVLVGEATMRAASGAVVFEAIGDHALKGKTTPIPAWRAVRVVAARGGQGRADTLEPPFVGRTEELRELKDVLHAVGRERRARLVSITGPGGIGKSRLVWELEKYIDGVAEDIYWHRGRSPSYGEGISFWALGEMVRRRAELTEDDDEATTRKHISETLAEYVSDPADRERIEPALLSLLGTEPAPAGGRDALFPAWRLFFERISERGTTVLVFEDLQWADTGLLDFIDHLLDWSKALPIMVVTLARPELFDRRPDWAFGRRHLTALALEPLTDAEMTELLAGLIPGVSDAAQHAIVARAEGVPLYAVETVRALLADGRIERRGEIYAPVGDLSELAVPDSLRSLIASRLDSLEPADRSLLQDAAVLGHVFSTDALAAINGAAAAELEPRLRGLVRGELLDIETDPRSPERGQFRFVQSLIREVAYGTLGRRDRRTRHLAVARHYEGLGDEEMAGALASHYVAAHDASDDGPEADAVAVQARLALTGAADRAAALGAPDQAVAFLDQALALTREPADRAPLLDRAARSATASAKGGEAYAREAIDTYRELGDDAAAAGATARLGKTLIEAGEVTHAIDLLEAALPAAEALGDDPVLAATLAHLSRAYMRLGRADAAVAVADRALVIGERLNLEPLVAEGLVNKGSSLHQLGRRREAIALLGLALTLAQRVGDRNLELRTANNLGAATADDDPLRATEIVRDAAEVAAQIGDRSMYNWLLGSLASSYVDDGTNWDAHVGRMREALESIPLPLDRARTLILLSLFGADRGEPMDELVAELRELAGDNTDPDFLMPIYMSESQRARNRGEIDAAFDWAMKGAQLDHQNPEVAAFAAVEAAIWGRNLEHARTAHRLLKALPQAGPVFGAFIASGTAAIAALEGRIAEAAPIMRESHATFVRLGQRAAAARIAVNAVILMPDEPEMRALAEASRPLLDELRMRPWLDRLDAALASAPTATAAGPTPTAEAPAQR